ncbi:MAG: hypothetical protein GX117_03705 [Candidatus Hydrogenedentes bacterium]|jgi:hypothetical protein|nr:hypothetical protein [Candidatus Hydrogenedentota bacterium]
MDKDTNRRDFVKQSLWGAALAGSTLAGAHKAHGQPRDELELPKPIDLEPEGALPQGKIGDLSISRILLGGNLLTHFTHSRDLKYVYTLCEHYNTDEKIMETMAVAEKHGVNTLVIHTVPRAMETLRTYRHDRGGKIQWIICPTLQVDEDAAAYRRQVKEIVDMGVEAVYLWGVAADRLTAEGNVDAMKRAVGIGHEFGLPSGVGAHDLRVIECCEEHGVPADFYIKTFHHHNYPSAPRPDQLSAVHTEVPGYWCQDPQAVIDVMSQVDKPWIAFKVMAAGAIPPENAFQYVFDNGADFSLAGMFDFEIEEDVQIAKKVLKQVNRHTRPWRA